MTKTLPYKSGKSLQSQIVGICCICYKSLLIIYLPTGNTKLAISVASAGPLVSSTVPHTGTTGSLPHTGFSSAWRALIDLGSQIQKSCLSSVEIAIHHDTSKTLKSQLFLKICVHAGESKSKRETGNPVLPSGKHTKIC